MDAQDPEIEPRVEWRSFVGDFTRLSFCQGKGYKVNSRPPSLVSDPDAYSLESDPAPHSEDGRDEESSSGSNAEVSLHKRKYLQDRRPTELPLGHSTHSLMHLIALY